MFSIENFDERPIKKDGNCLFRSVSIYINPILQTCRRKKDGPPTSKTYEVMEDNLASTLRTITTSYMTLHREKFENSLHFDDDYYDSIDERIAVISNNGEYAGNLELYVLSNILNIQINTFVRFPKDSKNYSTKYNLISKIGNYSKKCNLLIHDNHYHLLNIKDPFSTQFNDQLNEWKTENPEVVFNDIELSEDDNIADDNIADDNIADDNITDDNIADDNITDGSEFEFL